MNEETDYDDLFDLYEEVERQQAVKRYAKGYLQETEKSPIRKDVRERGAEADFDVFLDNVGEEGYERGYSHGKGDTESELLEDIRGLENTVDRLEELLKRQDPKRLAILERENEAMRKLSEEAVKEKKAILAELSYFLGGIMDTAPTPTDDVEAWAFQDGNNQAVMKVQEWVVRINAARELIEGESGPQLKKLPEQDMGTFRNYPYEEEDDEDWPPF